MLQAMRTAALTVLLLVLCTSHGTAQGPPTEYGAFLNWALMVRINEQWAAFTVCGSEPATWTNNERITETDRGMIAAHETNHREFMGSFGSCYAWHLWHYGNHAADVETEARAFCAGALHDYRTGRYGWMEAMHIGARMFSQYYPRDPNWNVAAALAEIVKYCR